MNDDLQTLSKLFTEKLFRIPDYQRGYAWTDSQLQDYWLDLLQISEDANHYTGVLTLESVFNTNSPSWIEDQWIIKSKRFEPFYVVDGQQRLTTSIILIQCIVDLLENPTDTINYTTKSEIQKKFLFDTKDFGVSRSYIFGYEKDNPSYEYLKTKIFGEISASDRKEETVYTNNLLKAKEFFKSRLTDCDRNEIEKIYIKVTQRLLFNIFSISNQVDVCVAFETMNNRGKPLSYLELLKNRLIYLTTKLEVEDNEATSLRKTINDSWKTIYHNLGRNKEEPLDDDFFLRCHHFLNYVTPIKQTDQESDKAKKYRILIRAIDSPEYKNLLNEIFTMSSVAEERNVSKQADNIILQRINEYSLSLQKSVKKWYAIFNPTYTNDPKNFNFWLAKLNKICTPNLYPVLLSLMLSYKSESDLVKAFSALERLIFLERLAVPFFRSNSQMTQELLSKAIELHNGDTTLDEFIRLADHHADQIAGSEWGKKQIKDTMRSRNFYTWRAIHYLLYEHNLYLQLISKTSREKIDWTKFVDREEDYSSIEHIYPQKAQAQYWKTNFKNLTHAQRELLKNVIGNLLPLSRPKNSSLSNLPYPEKVRGRTHGVGYAYGSYAENEVTASYNDWTPQAVLDRSLQILDFIENRWTINFGKDADKIDMLGLGFVRPNTRLTPRLVSLSEALGASIPQRRMTKHRTP
jgi:uncharacterized protein with ParB-like and HNH nuclease domain